MGKIPDHEQTPADPTLPVDPEAESANQCYADPILDTGNWH